MGCCYDNRLLVVSDLQFYGLSFNKPAIISLKDTGLEEFAEGMLRMGEETMSLPLAEKMRFYQGDTGNSFGQVI